MNHGDPQHNGTQVSSELRLLMINRNSKHSDSRASRRTQRSTHVAATIALNAAPQARRFVVLICRTVYSSVVEGPNINAHVGPRARSSSTLQIRTSSQVPPGSNRSIKLSRWEGARVDAILPRLAEHAGSSYSCMAVATTATGGLSGRVDF